MAKMQVGKNTKALIENPDFSEWSLEELVRGQRRSRTGRWQGRPPKVIPLELLHELNSRIAPEVHRDLLRGALEGARYLRAVAAGEVAADKDRMHAAEVCLNRTYGMAAQKIELGLDETSPYERAGVTRAIVIRSGITPAIEAESYEVEADPFVLDEPEPDPFLLPSDDLPEPPTKNPVDAKGQIHRDDSVWE